jgi:hypothetical protein
MSDQPQMTQTQPRVKPLRLLLLFGIAIGSITLLGLIGSEWPLVSAIAWHVRNGNTVTVEGHTFHVPLPYEPEISNGGAQIEMIEYPRLLGGIAKVTIESTGKILDDTATNRWQSTLIDAIQKHATTDDSWETETIRGTRLTFTCIVETSKLGQFLTCQANGTDIYVSTSASSGHINDTRAVLESSN